MDNTPNENSTVIRLDHKPRGRGISTHYDSTECGCRPDIYIEYTDQYGARKSIRLSRRSPEQGHKEEQRYHQPA